MNFLKFLKSLIPILGFTVLPASFYTLCFCDSTPTPGPITQSGPAEVPKKEKDPGSSSSAQLGCLLGMSGESIRKMPRFSAFFNDASKLCLAFEFLHFNPQENRGINTATHLANGTLK